MPKRYHPPSPAGDTSFNEGGFSKKHNKKVSIGLKKASIRLNLSMRNYTAIKWYKFLHFAIY